MVVECTYTLCDTLRAWYQVRIQMKNMSTDHSWVFHSNRFVDMRYKMQAVYHNYIQGFDWEPKAVSVCISTV